MNEYVFYTKTKGDKENAIAIYTHTLHAALREVNKLLTKNETLIETHVYPLHMV